MNHPLLISQFLTTPWALMPERLNVLAAVLARWSQDIVPSEKVLAHIDADRAARQVRRQTAASVSGAGIAVLPLYGVITQRGNMAGDVSGPGSCSLQMFTQSLRQALEDPSVSQILIDFDTPGGSVYGVDELASEINRAKSAKPIIGISNSLCASAGYYLASQCSELYCTPSGEVGSIGVYTAHQDMSAAFEQAGVKVQLISAGKYKTEGNPYGPLDADALAAIQASVDGYYAMFTKAVSKGRGVGIAQVRGGMGQGRCLSATDALAENMIDGIMSFDEVVAKMQKDVRSSRKMSAQIEVLDVHADLENSVSAPTATSHRRNLARRELELISL